MVPLHASLSRETAKAGPYAPLGKIRALRNFGDGAGNRSGGAGVAAGDAVPQRDLGFKIVENSLTTGEADPPFEKLPHIVRRAFGDATAADLSKSSVHDCRFGVHWSLKIGNQTIRTLSGIVEDVHFKATRYNLKYKTGALLNHMTARDICGIRPQDIEWIWIVVEKRNATPEEIRELCKRVPKV